MTVTVEERIVIVVKLEVPVVLREIDEGWKLSTYCHYHGAMYGQWRHNDVEG
jgi:hypothetical protein